MPTNPRQHSSLELLKQYANLMNELKRRKVIRTNNNPVGDYAESRACGAFDLSLEKGSQKSFDARDKNGVRYQIKGRRLTRGNDPKQLSIIRNLCDDGFDFLIGVIFDWEFAVLGAYKVPLQVIKTCAWWNERQNGHTVWLREPLISQEGVEDITESIERYSLAS